MKGPAEIAHGPMLIGFVFNVLLYGIMLSQVYLYFTAYQKDKTWMKLFVMLLLVCDTTNTVFDFIYLYKSLILRFGDPSSLAKADWLFATDPAITGITASLVQFFFAWRVRVLTRIWPPVILVFLGALSGGAGAIATSFNVGRTPEFVYFRDFKGVVIMWLASESITDIIITAILVWYLRCHKTGFQESDFIIDRVIRVTVQTGMITSFVATLDLIVFLTDPTGTHLIFNFPLCKLYTNCLMSSLNSRGGWQFGTTKPNLTTFLSERTMELNTPPQSPLSPTSPHSFNHHYRTSSNDLTNDYKELSAHERNRSAGYLSSLPRPPAVMQFKKQTQPEVSVRVGSGPYSDTN
ncbi:hypothetical protein GALMADRAFT_151614 [Galerina marginata CBS 339.88]|uniref:DUF6534 domain-containing protein n=1 Tax=Galerina marginata (strain CBS 339.88) TaxID=685588 RepID=A0A067TH45_GALM3|nr:hypothetical protein GALMADRAFT_151614 [Galerina marginata CBS 339.88]